MFPDTTELAENKLLLLYIFDRIGMPITNSHITQIILENNLINYFLLQQYLSELSESGFINSVKDDKRQVLSLTQRGVDALKFFIGRIPEKKIEIIDAYLETNITSIKKESQVISEYEPYANGSFLATLKLMKGEEILIDLKVPVKTNSEARKLCQLWKDDYSEIYGKIMGLLNK